VSAEDEYLMEATGQSVPSDNPPDYLMQDLGNSEVDILQPKTADQDKPSTIEPQEVPSKPDIIPEVKKKEKTQEEIKDATIIPTDHFLENCKKIMRHGLFKSGLRYLNTLIVFIL
jgi:hypothetical protein